MKKILLLAFFWAMPAEAAERVLDFHSDLRVALNGDLSVTERITVEVSGGGVIHGGIRRDLAATGVAVRSVIRNGAPEPYALERLAGGLRLRTGRTDAPLPDGRHVFEIAYTAARQVRFDGARDELHWDVTGNSWPLALERVSAELQLPGRVPARDIRPAANTGIRDARGNDYVSLVRDGAAAFRATRALRPGEGMAIVVTFPKGVVAAPSCWWC